MGGALSTAFRRQVRDITQASTYAYAGTRNHGELAVANAASAVEDAVMVFAGSIEFEYLPPLPPPDGPGPADPDLRGLQVRLGPEHASTDPQGTRLALQALEEVGRDGLRPSVTWDLVATINRRIHRALRQRLPQTMDDQPRVGAPVPAYDIMLDLAERAALSVCESMLRAIWRQSNPGKAITTDAADWLVFVQDLASHMHTQLRALAVDRVVDAVAMRLCVTMGQRDALRAMGALANVSASPPPGNGPGDEHGCLTVTLRPGQPTRTQPDELDARRQLHDAVSAGLGAAYDSFGIDERLDRHTLWTSEHLAAAIQTVTLRLLREADGLDE